MQQELTALEVRAAHECMFVELSSFSGVYTCELRYEPFDVIFYACGHAVRDPVYGVRHVHGVRHVYGVRDLVCNRLLHKELYVACKSPQGSLFMITGNLWIISEA